MAVIGKNNPLGTSYLMSEANEQFAKSEEVEGVRGEVTELDEAVEGLTDTVGGLSDTVDGLSDTVGGLSDTVGDLSDSVGSLEELIPTPTSADDGKVLTANDSGRYELETPSSGGLQNLVDTTGTGGVRQIIATETNAVGIFAIGQRAQCGGAHAIALGQDCRGSAPNSVSIGRYVQPTSSSNYAIGIGQYVTPSKEGQIVLGAYNETNANVDFILGNGNGGLRRHNIIEISNTNNNIKINNNTFTEAMLNYLFSLLTTPTTDGTYKLQCVVANGEPTFSWVAEV